MYSMTGFGRGRSSVGTLIAEVELTSVNRKQAEVYVNLSHDFMEHETWIRQFILSGIARGRVSAQIRISSVEGDEQRRGLDLDKISYFSQQCQQLSEILGYEVKPRVSDFLTIPNVFVEKPLDSDLVKECISIALKQALGALVEMRGMEGRDLKLDCLERLRILSELLEQLNVRAPQAVVLYRKNLEKRLQLLELPYLGASLLDDERVMKELVLYADRSDISEELTRLKSHLLKFKEYLECEHSVGRSLDFLCQELNRELNTIGAKAHDAALALLVVEGKTEVEKVREQVQNIE